VTFDITGTGFQIASESVPEMLGDAWLIAEIVIGFCDGMAAGAVYKPAVEIVPVAVEPPVIPFTCQVTLLFAALATVAVNCVVVPSRV
jgi:hypothetical protein